MFWACDATVWVVNACDRERIIEAREELARIAVCEDEKGLKDGAPLLVLVNKLRDGQRMGRDEIVARFADSVGDRPWVC